MKIYKEPQAPYLMRINIKRQGEKTEHLTICEANQQECFDFIKTEIEKQNISIFQTGKLTNIEIREGSGSENGKAISLSFKGLSPMEVKTIILNSLSNAQ